MLPTRFALASAALILLAATVFADESRQPDPLYQSLDVLDVDIVAPFSVLLSDRDDAEELSGTLQYENTADETVVFDIKLRARGRFRRQMEVCEFPPLRLNFKSSETKDTLFHKQDKVKLVTHCQASIKYVQVVLREYTAYRILNILTDASFRVRLLRINYVDVEGSAEVGVHYGFIIESHDRLAKRLDKDRLDIPETTVAALDPAYTSLVSLYQYMIGNTDFSPVQGLEGSTCCHNSVLFGDEDEAESEAIWSVPYDFDQSGLVNAPHASPSARFKLRSVKERLYRGRCAHNDDIASSVAVFNAKRDEIMAALQEVDTASRSSEKTMSRYIDRFYSIINSERKVASEFVKECI